MGVIAKSCLYPGTSTLLFNLLSSFADEDDDDLDDIMDGDGEDAEEDPNSWLNEYAKGCDWEIYPTDLADVFEGTLFSELASSFYLKLGVMLFAVKVKEITKRGSGGYSRLLINPPDFIIPSKRDFSIEGYVIAKNKVSSDLSFTSYTSPDVQLLVASTISRHMQEGNVRRGRSTPDSKDGSEGGEVMEVGSRRSSLGSEISFDIDEEEAFENGGVDVGSESSGDSHAILEEKGKEEEEDGDSVSPPPPMGSPFMRAKSVVR